MKRASLCAVVVSAVGCGLSELPDLVRTEPSVFRLPPTQLAEGKFGEFHLVSSTRHGAVVLALNEDDPASTELHIIRPTGESCSVGAANRFWYVPARSPYDAPEVVVYGAGPPAAQFVDLFVADLDCRQLAHFPEARLLHRAFPPENPFGLVFHDSQGALSFFDQMMKRGYVFVEGLEDVQRTPGGVWGRKDGSLHRYDTLSTWQAFGENVGEFVTESGRDSVAFRDGESLFYYKQHLHAGLSFPVPVAEDGCEPHLFLGGLSLSSPCEGGMVHVHSDRETEWDDETEQWYGPTVELAVPEVALSPMVIVHDELSDFHVYFLSQVDAETGAGDLWVAGRNGEATRLGERGSIQDGRLFLDWENRAGRLIHVTVAHEDDGVRVSEVETRGERVAQPIGGGWLANFDGETGDFVYVNQVLVRGVPLQRIPQDPDVRHVALVGDYEAGRGNLYLFGTSMAVPAMVGRGARPSTVRFFRDPLALVYLADTDGRAGVLRSYIVDSGLEQTLARGVDRYAIHGRIIVYSISSGPQMGLYWVTRR